jgi:hypothetical protein
MEIGGICQGPSRSVSTTFLSARSLSSHLPLSPHLACVRGSRRRAKAEERGRAGTAAGQARHSTQSTGFGVRAPQATATGKAL